MKTNLFRLIALLLVLATSGCQMPFSQSSHAPAVSLTESAANVQKTSDISGKLKVAYWSADQFMKDYGSLFQSKYPNVEFEVISLPYFSQTKDYETTFKKLIEDNQIDLVYTRGFLQHLAQNNVLYDLTSLIKRDNYDLSKIYPSVLERLQQMGDDKKLYGLSTTFLMKALYYNKDLFDQYAIPYPKDNMTWSDVLQLSKKFNTGGAADQIIGLSVADPSPYQLLKDIAKSEGLSEFDASGRYTINTPEWIAIWDFVAEQIRARSIVIEGNKQIGTDAVDVTDHFRKGLSAMTISNSVTVRELLQAGIAFNWALVTEPVNKTSPNESDSLTLSDVFAIHLKSNQVDLAWEFLKFLNSDEGTVLLHKQDHYALTSHTPFVKEVQGHDLQAFYKLQLKKSILDSVPPSFYQQISASYAAQFAIVVAGEKSVADAVKELETKGNELLKSISASE